MPAALTYPGAYIEEVPSGVRTITGVATSITAFIGRARRGPVNEPVRIQSQAEFARVFGGLWQPSTLGYAVSHFFQHGGADALIVRAFSGDQASNSATLTLATSGGGTLVLEAASPGAWGDRLRVSVDSDTSDPTNLPLEFNLLVEELDQPGGTNVVASELHRNLVTDPASRRFVDNLLEEQSALVRVRTSGPADERPVDVDDAAIANPDGTATAAGTLGGDGGDLTDTDLVPTNTTEIANREGMYALEAADLFNMLCIPPPTRTGDVAFSTWANAARYCQERRAVLIIDPPTGWSDVSDTTDTGGINDLRSAVGNNLAINAAVYFPHLRMSDPLTENRPAEFAPCGAVAGIIARTDAQRGIWKAPAGLDASFSGVQGFSYTMTDSQNGIINPLGLNALRTFPVSGNLVWGARTLAGADQLASEWKYLPVRRLALFLEESLFRGTQWVVFEPNDEPLWAQIRLNIGAFMQNLFRQGAFQGSSPRDAYFVKCDSETTTQNDIDRGVVNIVVGFAPLKPAEFVVIKLQQIAGEIEV